jgi:beta-N-acetylhexosaminidase
MAVMMAMTFVVQAADEPAKVDIRGKATKVLIAPKEAQESGLLGTVLIEGVKEKTTSFDKASVKITSKTTIEKMVGTERKPAKIEDLKQGSKVEANFAGPVAESYPVQATAKEILILDEAK